MTNANEYSSAVELTHRTLELLKYIGGYNEGRPTGEGISVEIVLMPDLLLDFRSRYLNDFNRTTCSVGGRAARAACALLHLQSNEDQLFRCKLLTRTGNLGTLLLSNEFADTPASDIFESACRPYVLQREREPRCAIRYFVDAQGRLVLESNGQVNVSEMIRSSDPSDEHELRAADIDNSPKLSEFLRRADSIYFSSFRSQGYLLLFKSLIQLLTDTKTESNAHVFTDVARLHQAPEGGALPSFINYLKEVRGDRSVLDKMAGIFIPTDAGEYFSSLVKQKLCKCSKELNVPLIVYGDERGVSVHWPSGKELVSVEGSLVDFSREDVPERFKAGMVLAYAVGRAIDRLGKVNSDLHMHLRQQWGDVASEDFWKNVVKYGLALGAAQSQPGNNFASLRDLFNTVGDFADMCYPQEVSFSTEPFDAIAKNHRNFFSGRSLINYASDLVRAAGYRRIKAFQQYEKAFICSEHKCTPCAKKGKESEAYAAVLIDLDSTLLNSTEQRNQCLRSVMEHLADPDRAERGSHVPIKSIKLLGRAEDREKLLDFFQRYVYDLWPLYKKWTNEDFRQQWNTEGWYVTLAALLKYPKLFDEISRVEKTCGNVREIDRMTLLEKCANSESHLRDMFSTARDEVRRDHMSFVTHAIHVFSKGRMSLYKEAFDFLETMNQLPGIRLYIVSEGIPESQWMKVQNTGLAEYIPRGRVLTTGHAAEPTELNMTLNRARTAVSERKQTLDAEQKHLASMVLLFAELDNAFEILNGQGIDVDKRFRDRIEKFINDRKKNLISRQVRVQNEMDLLNHRMDCLDCLAAIVDRMREKRRVTFYAGVFRAILHDPISPRDQLILWDKLVSDSPSREKMKFAMIGDRNKNDIVPPQELLGKENILTIRMLSEKYFEEDGESQQTATYTVNTLAQAKAILLSRVAWEGIKCTFEPPFFNYFVVTDPKEREQKPRSNEDAPKIGIDHVLFGIDMVEYSLIHRVFASILCEFLRKEVALKNEDVARIIFDIVCDERHPQCIRRSMLTISMIVKGNAFDTFSLDTRPKLLTRLINGTKLAVQLGAPAQPAENYRFFHKAVELSMEVIKLLQNHSDRNIFTIASGGYVDIMRDIKKYRFGEA